MKLQLRSIKLGSQSLKRLAVALSESLGYKVLRTRYPNPKRKQLAYGNMADKLSQYQWFKDNEIPCPEWTTSRDQAVTWLQEGKTVFSRTLLRASEGRGIRVAETVDQLVTAPVYTKYEKKKREFRVHIFKDKVVACVEKRKRKEFQGDRDHKIRNLANGYVFCRSVTDIPDGLHDLAVKASKVTASDFKGVDIGYNEKQNKLFVIEVNSAPGIEGSNVDAYVQAILN